MLDIYRSPRALFLYGLHYSLEKHLFDEQDRILSRPLSYHLKALEGDLVLTEVILFIEPLHHFVPGLNRPRPQRGVPSICSVY